MSKQMDKRKHRPKFKGNKSREETKKPSWKSMDVKLENASDLLCFEELTDYKIVRGKEGSVSYTRSETAAKEKRKKKTVKKASKCNKRKNNTSQDDGPSAKNRKIVPISTKLVDEETNVDMSLWNEFFLPESIVKSLAAKKFTCPTEIQKLVLPEAIMKKKDVLGAAETGSGKTLAFAIPIIASLLQAKDDGTDTDGKLWALIVTPTRELAIQIRDHIRDLCVFNDIKVLEIVGGMSIEKQDRKLKEKPHIVVGTPGRLWELIRTKHDHLAQVHAVRFFVIDEADRMFEKNHFDDFNNLLEYLNENRSRVQKHHQTLVFSATLTLAHEVPSYVLKKQKGKPSKSNENPSQQKLLKFIDSLGLKNPSVIDITRKNVLAAGISEQCLYCSLEEKDYYLYYILRVHKGKKIIFVNSVSCVKRLQRLLKILQCNVKVLFADMAQHQRLKNLENFHSDPDGLLLATDVAARGLDIPDIDYIIHYQVPKTSEIYVHRSGRSVRGCAAQGTSILLCCPSEYYFCEKIRKTLVKEDKLPTYSSVRPEMFQIAKQAVDISRKIERTETKIHNVQTNANWIEKCAKEMDILLDDDEKPDRIDNSTRKSQLNAIKKLKAELNDFISKPILPLDESLKYPRFKTVQSFLKQYEK